MKKVKFLGCVEPWFNQSLTLNKIYDVIEFKKVRECITFEIYDDINFKSTYHITSRSISKFEDVTQQYRSEIIDEILN